MRLKNKGSCSVQTGASLTNAPKIGSNEKVKRISLMENQIESLSKCFSCSKLITLFLNNNNLETISNGFFHSMPYIKVLNLSNNNPQMLPRDISLLISLQHLDISFNKINDLLNDYKVLVNLENLKIVGLIYKIPRQLLPSFSKLRVLGIGLYNFVINEEEDDVLYGDSMLWVSYNVLY